MRLSRDFSEQDSVVVFLDGKWVRAAVDADSDEGWCDVPDLKPLAPLDLLSTSSPSDGDVAEEWEKLPLVRKHGRVELKKIS